MTWKINRKIYKSKFISNKLDIYKLENYKDKIVKLDGFGEKSFLT